jgi:hypothetical protein
MLCITTKQGANKMNHNKQEIIPPKQVASAPPDPEHERAPP